MEEYRIIKECPNYEVSNLGNIRNKNTKYVLKPHKNLNGYLWMNLRYNGKFICHGIHKYVAEAFIKKPKTNIGQHLTANHKNKIRE